MYIQPASSKVSVPAKIMRFILLPLLKKLRKRIFVFSGDRFIRYTLKIHAIVNRTSQTFIRLSARPK